MAAASQKIQTQHHDDKEAITTKAIAPAGSVLFTHGALWHRAGANISKKIKSCFVGKFCSQLCIGNCKRRGSVIILNQQSVEKNVSKIEENNWH